MLAPEPEVATPEPYWWEIHEVEWQAEALCIGAEWPVEAACIEVEWQAEAACIEAEWDWTKWDLETERTLGGEHG